MKYTVNGLYEENKDFNNIISEFQQFINIDSINAGYGRFYFETNEMDSKSLESFQQYLDMSSLKVSNLNGKKPSKLLQYISETTVNGLNDLNDFTVIKTSQNYYNILKYLEK